MDNIMMDPPVQPPGTPKPVASKPTKGAGPTGRESVAVEGGGMGKDEAAAPPLKEDPDGAERKPEDFAGEPVADPWEVDDGELDSGGQPGQPQD